jgi:glycosyltransferase involved in cell wall biosynthesis
MAAAAVVESSGGREFARTRLGLKSGDASVSPLFLTISRLIPDRNLQDFVPVIRSVLQSNPAAQWAIIGDGPDAGILRPLLQEFPDQFRMEGSVTDSGQLALWYAAADAFVLYGFVGLGAVQSFAHGLPVLYWQGQPHSPEVDYCLAHNSRAIGGSGTPEDQSREIAGYLASADYPHSRKGVQTTVGHLTLENMVARMVDGIDRLLA